MRTKRRRSAVIIPAAAMLILAGCLLAHSAVQALYPRGYENTVAHWCDEYGVEESLVYAVIHTESGFDPSAVSDMGALGLMQLTPDTFEWLQTKTNEPPLEVSALHDPDVNIRYGVFFLSLLLDEFGSDRLAVAAYHAGRGRVGGWLDSGQLTASPEISDIPSRTTGHYVHKVERARRVYVSLYYD